MEALDLMLARRSVRRFTTEDVSVEDEQALIDAAFAAPKRRQRASVALHLRGSDSGHDEPRRPREERVQQTARDIFAAMRPARHPLLSPERWQSEMMEWAMADERLKVEMLRFVDVFPHAAQPPRDEPPPARVLRPAGRRDAQGPALGHQPRGETARRWLRWRAA